MQFYDCCAASKWASGRADSVDRHSDVLKVHSRGGWMIGDVGKLQRNAASDSWWRHAMDEARTHENSRQEICKVESARQVLQLSSTGVKRLSVYSDARASRQGAS